MEHMTERNKYAHSRDGFISWWIFSARSIYFWWFDQFQTLWRKWKQGVEPSRSLHSRLLWRWTKMSSVHTVVSCADINNWWTRHKFSPNNTSCDGTKLSRQSQVHLSLPLSFSIHLTSGPGDHFLPLSVKHTWTLSPSLTHTHTLSLTYIFTARRHTL